MSASYREIVEEFVRVMDGCGNWPDSSSTMVRLGDLADKARALPECHGEPLGSIRSGKLVWNTDGGPDALRKRKDYSGPIYTTPQPIPADVVQDAEVKYPQGKYTDKQREWCELYEHETGFDPHAMGDYEAGNLTFVQAAKNSVAWFEDWSSDAYLRLTKNGIPGDEWMEEDIDAAMKVGER